MEKSSQKRPPARHRLTDLYIRNLKPPTRTRVIWDEKQTGLGIQITPKGVKSFKVVYRFQHRPRWYNIGRYGEVDLKEARRKAQEVLSEVEQPGKKNPKGYDPQAEKMILRRGETLKQVAEQYVETT